MASGQSRKGGSEVTLLPVNPQDGTGRVTSDSMENMAEEQKPKEESKQENKKTTKNGGYTIPAQMT